MSSNSIVMSEPKATMSETKESKSMKSIPMKYLKYMCYGLYMLKRICPHPEEYAARSVELLKLHGSVEEIIHDIDYILDGPLKTEMHEIKTIRKNLNKPAKPQKPSKSALKDKPLAAAIVESAQQSTVEHVIAHSDSDHDDISDIINPTVAAAAEKAVHDALKSKKDDDKAKKEAEKAQKEAEKAQKEAEKAAEKAKKEAEKEAEKAKKEAEKAQKEAEKAKKDAEKEAEKAKKEAEKAQKEAEKAAEKAKKEAEKASKVKSIKVPVPVVAELTAEPEK